MYGKFCANVYFACYADVAAVQVNNPLHNGQAKSGACSIPCGISTKKTLENMRQMFPSDADTVILYRQQYAVLLPFCVYPHIAAFFPILRGIPDEIKQ